MSRPTVPVNIAPNPKKGRPIVTLVITIFNTNPIILSGQATIPDKMPNSQTTKVMYPTQLGAVMLSAKHKNINPKAANNSPFLIVSLISLKTPANCRKTPKTK